MNRKEPIAPWKVLELSTGRTNLNGGTMELTDLHNRNRNINTVAKECQEHNYPLLVWPEDKELLQLSQLPQFPSRPNCRANWLIMEGTQYKVIRTNQELQDFITPGFAYSILTEQPRGYYVQEYRVTCRPAKLMEVKNVSSH